MLYNRKHRGADDVMMLRTFASETILVRQGIGGLAAPNTHEVFAAVRA